MNVIFETMRNLTIEVKRVFNGFFICFVLSTKLSSQSFDLGNWNIVNIRYHSSEKLSYFGEAQLRSLKFYDNFHY